MSKYDDLASVWILIRHVRNCSDLGPHPLRARALEADKAFQRALGAKEIKKVTATDTWKHC